MLCLVFLTEMTRILLILDPWWRSHSVQISIVVLFFCIFTQTLSVASKKQNKTPLRWKYLSNGKLSNVYTVVSGKTARSLKHVSLAEEHLCDMWHAQKVMNIPQSHMVAVCSHHRSPSLGPLLPSVGRTHFLVTPFASHVPVSLYWDLIVNRFVSPLGLLLLGKKKS